MDCEKNSPVTSSSSMTMYPSQAQRTGWAGESPADHQTEEVNQRGTTAVSTRRQQDGATAKGTTLRIATWNVRSAVLGISEVRWSGCDKVTRKNFDFIYSGGDKHENGVGLLIRKLAVASSGVIARKSPKREGKESQYFLSSFFVLSCLQNFPYAATKYDKVRRTIDIES